MIAEGKEDDVLSPDGWWFCRENMFLFVLVIGGKSDGADGLRDITSLRRERLDWR